MEIMDIDAVKRRLTEIESWQDQESEDGRVIIERGVVPWLCELVRVLIAENERLRGKGKKDCIPSGRGPLGID